MNQSILHTTIALLGAEKNVLQCRDCPGLNKAAVSVSDCRWDNGWISTKADSPGKKQEDRVLYQKPNDRVELPASIYLCTRIKSG